MYRAEIRLIAEGATDDDPPESLIRKVGRARLSQLAASLDARGAKADEATAAGADIDTVRSRSWVSSSPLTKVG